MAIFCNYKGREMKTKFEKKLEKVKEEAIKENIPIIMDETLEKIKETLKE